DAWTGAVTEWASPRGPKSEPYGSSAIDDVIWYSESGSSPNTVVRFEPKSAKFQSWAIPGGGNIVRNTSVTRDGSFVLANSLVNAVTLVKISKSRSEEHTSESSHLGISYAVFCLKKKKKSELKFYNSWIIIRNRNFFVYC